MDKRRLVVFFEFLIFGVLLGILEDIIIIKLVTGEPITSKIIGIIFLVTLPFAFIGEYLVDRVDFLKLFKIDRKYRRWEVFLEFLIFGIFMGVTEDLIALTLSTGEPITWGILGIVTLVAIPFAILGELIVDKIDFLQFFSKNN
jgi:hypothetical protein